MAYDEEAIKSVVQVRLQKITKEVISRFEQEPSVHVSEDEINLKVAAAVAAAFSQFVKDAVISIPVQAVSGAGLALGTIPITGTATLPAHEGKIT